MSLLSIDHIEVRYGSQDGDVVAIKDVSLEIKAGETVGLVGESGCGKSTIALAIMDYLGSNGRLSAGTIRFDGRDISRLSVDDLQALRGGDVAMVYQEPFSALNPSMRIGDQLSEIPITHEGVDRDRAREAVTAALSDVQLTDSDRISRSFPHQLSGGQLQRVVIAMTLLGKPRLILMDEPTTALDPTVEAEIMDLIAELQRKTGVAILFISHNLALVHKICRRVSVMKDGVIVEEGDAATVYRTPGHPQTRLLLDAVPSLLTVPERSSSKPGETVINVSHVSKYYPIGEGRFGAAKTGMLVANEDISFTVQRGEKVAIVGESGGGKSTLAKMVMGLEIVSGGTILVAGQNVGSQLVSQRSPKSLRRIQMVFQNPGDTLNPSRKVGAQLSRVVKKLGSLEYRNDIGARVRELLGAVDLPPETVDRYPGTLSGGQRQRIAIARALAAEPDIIVADEPLSALDVSVQASIADIFRDLCDSSGLTLLFISHDLARVRQLADRVIVMESGRVVEQGPTEDIFAPPHHPYTARLIEAVPTIVSQEGRGISQ
ncbi:MAG: ABC transporter ATP-binding protein [Proteobacteria bacterium]|nr:ABC transporter ATP-binding protein [Pseudomonadota bacterium]